MSHRLLAVRLDPVAARLASGFAAQGGHALANASSGGAALEEAARARPHLILLGQELPDMHPLSWLRHLRGLEGGSAFGVVLLVSRRSPEEAAAALDLEADDYVHADLRGLAEVFARLRAALRRRFERQEASPAPMRRGIFEVDARQALCRVRGRSVRLRAKEFALLEALMRRPGRVYDGAQLVEAVWGNGENKGKRALQVTLSRLRQALGRGAAGWVETVDKLGYRFRDPGVFDR